MFIFGLPGTIKLKMNILLRAAIREMIPFYSKRFQNSNQYWQDRYKFGGTSGKGSRGKLAVEKAALVNALCQTYNIGTIVEFGSGDGVCASMFDTGRYIGFDISDVAIEFAKDRCPDRNKHRFFNYSKLSADEINATVLQNRLPGSVMSLSMDVIFHLVEDDVFYKYIDTLCKAPSDYIVVRSSDIDGCPHAHYRDRAYSQILIEKYGLKLIEWHRLPADGEHSAYSFKVFGR
jgi:hypothetical protein